MSEQVIIIGSGGHGRVIADSIRMQGDRVVGFLDDNQSKEGVLGTVADCVRFLDKKFVIGIGDNRIRKAIRDAYPGLRYHTVIHPRAVVAQGVTLGAGTVVMANAVINAGAKIGCHCILNTMSVVEHDDCVGDYVHLSPGAVLCGGVTVGDGCHIGANAVVKHAVTIGKEIVIGCGGCVIRNLAEPGSYAGVPVRKLEK